MIEQKIIERPIAADWWILVGAAQAILSHDEQRDKQRCADDRTPRAPNYNSGPDADGFHISFYDPQQFGRRLGELRFTRGATAAIVRGEVAPEVYSYCADLVETLDRIAGLGHNVRRWYEPNADEVIERYYRSRAAGARTTLRQLAEDTGLSYEALKKHKQRYDRAGKWGSKRDKVPRQIDT